MPRTFSLPALTVIELDPPELVSAAADAGYDYVGLRLIPATPDERRYPVIGDTPMVREILARLSDRGISVLDIEVFRLKPETRVEDFAPAIETAARLGARHLLVTGQDTDMSRLADTFARLCDMAAKFSMVANMEFMPWTEINSLPLLRQVMDLAERANAGILLDPLHIDRCGTPIDDIKKIPRRFLHFMQLCDAPAERPSDPAVILQQARGGRLIPGEGGLPLPAYVRALPDNIPISLEIPMAEMTKTVGAVERARRALIAAKALVKKVH